MITEQIFYGIRCDRCGKDYESCGDYSYYTDKGDVIDAAADDCWETIDGHHYCPGCYEENPDPDHDNDHVYRPKPSYPISIHTLRQFLKVIGGYKEEEYEDTLIFKFWTEANKKDVDSEYRALIDKILHMQQYRIEVVDIPSASNAKAYIYITLKRFYKGQRVRVIHHHSRYRDDFGKEGEIVAEAPTNCGANACYGVHIFDDDDPQPHYLQADYLELVNQQ